MVRGTRPPSRAFYRWLACWIGPVYLVLFMIALRDISLGGRGFGFRTTDWTRMFDRTATVTFEPVARLTVPGVTVLISPLNLAIGAVLSLLVGLNLLVTWIAWRRPAACSFNRATGVFASIPALFAGGACCAPAIVLILGIQMTSAMVTTFQALIPLALLLLLATLTLILDRTNAELAVSGAPSDGVCRSSLSPPSVTRLRPEASRLQSRRCRDRSDRV